MGFVKQKDGCWYFEDKNGNLSKGAFSEQSSLGGSFYAVKCVDDDLWHVIDNNGYLSMNGYKQEPTSSITGSWDWLFGGFYRGWSVNGNQRRAIYRCRDAYLWLEDKADGLDKETCEKKVRDALKCLSKDFKDDLMGQYINKQISEKKLVSQAKWFVGMLKTEREAHEERVKLRAQADEKFAAAFKSIDNLFNGPKG